MLAWDVAVAVLSLVETAPRISLDCFLGTEVA